MAAGGVKMGALDAPSVRLLGLDEASVSLRYIYHLWALVAHRGALYLVAELEMSEPGPVDVVCGVWQLVRQDQRSEWQGVAQLETPVVEQLTGVRLGFGRAFHLIETYGVRELVCVHLMEGPKVEQVDEEDTDDETGHLEPLVGFNLDRGMWELVYCEHEHLTGPMAFELRPDLFLSS